MKVWGHLWIKGGIQAGSSPVLGHHVLLRTGTRIVWLPSHLLLLSGPACSPDSLRHFQTERPIVPASRAPARLSPAPQRKLLSGEAPWAAPKATVAPGSKRPVPRATQSPSRWGNSPENVRVGSGSARGEDVAEKSTWARERRPRHPPRLRSTRTPTPALPEADSHEPKRGCGSRSGSRAPAPTPPSRGASGSGAAAPLNPGRPALRRRLRGGPRSRPQIQAGPRLSPPSPAQPSPAWPGPAAEARPPVSRAPDTCSEPGICLCSSEPVPFP
ncbi:hypothetical protein H8959_021764 [Pygathrix nigripes]